MIQAIETNYRGYRFRSRLEARWAVFFDALGIRWEYEREGFQLADGTPYLPDFWLPELGVWLEVKGTDPTPEELRKAELLFVGHGAPVAIGSGEPGHGALRVFCCDSCDSGGGQMWWEGCAWGWAGSAYAIDTRNGRQDRSWLDHAWEPVPGIVGAWQAAPVPEIEAAADLARAARFEHGADPTPAEVLRPRPRVSEFEHRQRRFADWWNRNRMRARWQAGSLEEAVAHWTEPMTWGPRERLLFIAEAVRRLGQP